MFRNLESPELHRAHLASPHMAEYREAVGDLRKSVQVEILSPVM